MAGSRLGYDKLHGDVSMRVAIVGAGVSGLSAAYALRDQAEIVLFEKNTRLGGHANTVEVEEDGNIIGIETAFMVFTNSSYPNFCRFLQETGVEAVPHTGTFTFSDHIRGIEYPSADLVRNRVQLEAIYPAWFCDMVDEVKRFRREASSHLYSGQARMTLGKYLDLHGYSQVFRESYLMLIIAEVWSIPVELIWEMPASTVLGYFLTRGEGGIGELKGWCTVKGGSISYIRRVLDMVKPEVRLGAPVVHIREKDDKVSIQTAQGGEESFDYVIVAAHGDETAAMLGGSEHSQALELLSMIRYKKTDVVLHSDESVMPKDRKLWASWNYARVRVDDTNRSYVACHMNQIQGLASRRQFFVTLEYPLSLREETILQRYDYTHPVIDLPLNELQHRLYSLNTIGRVKFCGAYFHAKEFGPDLIGSHESGFSSGKEAAKAVLDMEASSMVRLVI
jgi:uncharacterized protein